MSPTTFRVPDDPSPDAAPDAPVVDGGPDRAPVSRLRRWTDRMTRGRARRVATEVPSYLLDDIGLIPSVRLGSRRA
ncbi:hypothetical protein [Rubellimicrobium arenae]|uniref:hypothetical protein n=1 Tax=Rubellimicrobium arenae TaxID=2817372 RepID=UPI001B31058C|nr:hypothetical protein [Rubellimicrobium arenae]